MSFQPHWRLSMVPLLPALRLLALLRLLPKMVLMRLLPKMVLIRLLLQVERNVDVVCSPGHPLEPNNRGVNYGKLSAFHYHMKLRQTGYRKRCQAPFLARV